MGENEDETASYGEVYEEWRRYKTLAARITSKRTYEECCECFKNLDKINIKLDEQDNTEEIKELLEYNPSKRNVAADRRKTMEILALVEILKEKENSPVSKILDGIP